MRTARVVPNPVGFTRWYDRTPELSQAVRNLEKIQPEIQQLIAKAIIRYHEKTTVLKDTSEHGSKKLGSQKIIGLMKSKSKRRWYDVDPLMHKAFNDLFVMEDWLRFEVAVKMLVSMEAITTLAMTYEYQIKNIDNGFDRLIIDSIFGLQTSFLLEKVKFTLKGKPETLEEVIQAEIAEPDNKMRMTRKTVEDSPQGMKISAETPVIQTLI